MAGIPVVSYSGNNGGFGIIDTYKLDRQLLTLNDMLSILSALKGVNTTLEDRELDTAIEKIHSLVPKEVWTKRYDHINAFEKLLADEGTTILKFYLNIDLDEQKERLQSRLDRPDKHWKFNPGDLDERKLWPAYMEAFEEALSKTSTPWAPWFIIPANRKWYRNLVVAQILVDRLEQLNMRYPEADFDPTKITIE